MQKLIGIATWNYRNGNLARISRYSHFGILIDLGHLNLRVRNCISTIEIAPTFCGMSEDDAWKAATESLPFWQAL